MRAQCPICESDQLTPVYEASAVPAQSCDRSRPGQPSADLAIAHCTSCDLAFNAAFDAGLVDYAPAYDGSQAASPTFTDYQQNLARTLAIRFVLDDTSTLIEVGAGRGEFLAALAEHTPCSRIAIDPAFPSQSGPVQTRSVQTGPDAPGLTVHRFGLLDAPPTPPADAIVCRQTLEHIAAPLPFLRAMNDRLKPGGWLMVEVPAAERIWREGAFWDLYHEHATYFTASSLHAALTRAGFAVGLIAPEYDSQHLVALARRPDRDQVPSLWPGTPAATPADVRQRLRSSLEHWQRRVAMFTERGPWAIWGAGSKAVAFCHATCAQPGAQPSAQPAGRPETIVDLNPALHGTTLAHTPSQPAQRIQSPSVLSHLRPHTVLAMNPIYREEITRAVRALSPGAMIECLGD